MIDYLIEIEDWNMICGEGCVKDYGTSIFINDILITNHFNTASVECWEDLIKNLGVKNTLITYKK